MRSVNQIIKMLGKELDSNPKDIKNVVDFYWESIRNEMVNPTSPNLYIPHIGTFSLSLYKINRKIRDLIKGARKQQQNVKLTEERKEKAINEIKELIKKLWVQRNIVLKEYGERRELWSSKRA